LGEHEPAAWGHLSIYASWRCKHSIVNGNAGGPCEAGMRHSRRSRVTRPCP
jgi:hypothetical protein